jgi:quercetin 2,3-dioxygenase
MIVVRPAAERGRTELAWLDSRHTFSFGGYHDARHMGFRSLRVINDDRVIAGAGFGTHGHRDMEILSYVVSGALAHKDSLGTGSVIRPGELQRMSAGSGIMHSEFNDSRAQPVHFLQIWILPQSNGIAPGYEQKAFPAAERDNRWQLIADRTGAGGSITVHQDLRLFAADLGPGPGLQHAFAAGRHGWLQVVTGSATLDGRELAAGDGVAISAERGIALTTASRAELLLFDLA